MTTKLAFLVLLPILAVGQVSAQSISESLQGLAEMHNEQHGNDESEGETAANGPTEAERAEWENGWGKKLEENGEILGAMSTPDLRCVAMMVLYVYEHESIVDMTDRESNCRRKYDLYGMQLLSIAASTTIMYCPEGLNAYSNEQLDQIAGEYGSILKRNVPDSLLVDLQLIWNERTSDEELPEHSVVVSGWSRLYFKTMYLLNALLDTDVRFTDGELQLNINNYFIRSLIRYFTPRHVVTNTFQIGQKMEALGCAP